MNLKHKFMLHPASNRMTV